MMGRDGKFARLTRPSISAFFPAYNDESTIGGLVSTTLHVLAEITDDFEVIVVNDGSTDGTADVLESLARDQPRLRLVHHRSNRGYGAALRSGFEHARKDLIFYTDGDGQYDPGELPALFARMGEGVDIVNGFKLSRSDERIRIAVGSIYNWAARLFFRVPISDVDCDFRLIRRRALAGTVLESSSGAICTELVWKLKKAGRTFTEVPVRHYPRSYGSSQFFTPRSVMRTTVDFVRLWVKLVVIGRFRRGQQRASAVSSDRYEL